MNRTFLINKKYRINPGISLLEVIVGSAIISMVLISLGSVGQFSLHVAKKSSLRLQAVFLASEGVEAVRSLRDSGWASNIAGRSSGTDYYLEFVTDHYAWTAAPPPRINGMFQRRFVVEDVYRDVNGDIASSGTLDPDTKKVTVVVDWTYRNVSEEETIRTYITNIFSN